MQEIILNFTRNKLQGTISIAEPWEWKSICIPAWLGLDNLNNFIDKIYCSTAVVNFTVESTNEDIHYYICFTTLLHAALNGVSVY